MDKRRKVPGPFREEGGIDDETNGPGGEVCRAIDDYQV